MSNDKIKIGSHDTGIWDIANNIQAKKRPLASSLNIQNALTKAKNQNGAELVIVKQDGQASVHSLSVEDSLIQENKKILVSELDQNTARSQDLSKTPLAVANNIATAFSGSVAFLVGENNQVAYLGADVDQTTARIKLLKAEEFLVNPTRAKVDTAYQIATIAGKPKHVEQVMARHTLAQFEHNYRNTTESENNIGLLKPGTIRSQMEGLLEELKNLAGQESQRVSELQSQLQIRTQEWQITLAQPAEKLKLAKQNWNRTNTDENKKVSTAVYHLREARMPNIHQLEITFRST